jgi:putative two-component system response regulator
MGKSEAPRGRWWGAGVNSATLLADTSDDDKLLLEAEALIGQALLLKVDDLEAVQRIALRLAYVKTDRRRAVAIMCDAMRALYIGGRSSLSVVVIERANRLATEHLALSDTLLLDTFSLLTISLADTDDLVGAMEVAAEGLSIAEDYGNSDKLLYVKMWQNLAAAMMYAGLYSDAEEAYKLAMGLAIERGHKDQEIVSLCNLNCTSLHTLNYELADEAFARLMEYRDAATAMLAEPVRHRSPFQGHYNLVIGFFYRVLVQARRGEVADARRLLSEMLRTAESSASPRTALFVDVATGAVEVREGEVDVGLKRMTDAMARSFEKNASAAKRTILHELVATHEYLGQTDSALAFLRELIRLLSTSTTAAALRQVGERLGVLAGGALDADLVQDAAAVLADYERVAESLAERSARRARLQNAVQGLERMALATELREDSTGEHIYRVGRLAYLIARKVGCNEEAAHLIGVSARMHDIGKCAVPDAILNKAEPLSASDRQFVNDHAEKGAAMLERSALRDIGVAVAIARHHHENWDGTGYPSGLVGEAIPLAARIAAVADAFDSMTHSRRYRPTLLSPQEALSEICANSGTKFDPACVAALGDVLEGISDGFQTEELDAELGREARASRFAQAKTQIWSSLRRAAERREGRALAESPVLPSVAPPAAVSCAQAEQST